MPELYKAKIKNGQIVLDKPLDFPDDTEVIIDIFDVLSQDIEAARKDLVEKITEGMNCPIEEGEEHHVFFERLMKKFNGDDKTVEPFDYTKRRENLFSGMTLEELADNAQKFCEEQ